MNFKCLCYTMSKTCIVFTHVPTEQSLTCCGLMLLRYANLFIEKKCVSYKVFKFVEFIRKSQYSMEIYLWGLKFVANPILKKKCRQRRKFFHRIMYLCASRCSLGIRTYKSLKKLYFTDFDKINAKF